MRFLFVIAVFCVSCSGKPNIDIAPPEPEGLLGKEKFTQVMVDMELIEATLKLKLIRKKKIRERTPGYYDQILDEHKITEDQFSSSFDFYNEQPVIMTEIFDSVHVRLVRKRDAMDIHEKDRKKNRTKDVQEKPEKKQ